MTPIKGLRNSSFDELLYCYYFLTTQGENITIHIFFFVLSFFKYWIRFFVFQALKA